MRISFCIYRPINRQNTGYNYQIWAIDARNGLFCVILSDGSFHFPPFFSLLMAAFRGRNQRFIMECTLLWTITGYRPQCKVPSKVYSRASGLSGCEGVLEVEPQAVDFPVGRAENGDLQRIVMVGHAAGDEFQPGTAAPAEGNEAGAACVKRLAGFESGGPAGETAKFLFEEIHVTPP
jgi:hypothetical protein